MSNKLKVLLVVISLAVSFAVGRFLTPVKTVVETKIVEVTKTDKKVDKETHTKTTIVETKHPDGTVTKTTTISKDTDLKKDTTTTSSESSDTTKTVQRDSGFLLVSALGGVNVTNGVPSFGASINKNLLGPVSVGLWGLNNGIVGASVGLKF